MHHDNEGAIMADATTPNPSKMPVSGPVGATRAASSSGDTHARAGKTVIEDGVVAKVAGIAASEVPGVYALGGNVSRAVGAIRDTINMPDQGQGVGVEVGERQVAVDLTLVAEYPMSLQKVADDVRAAVYGAIENIVGMEVAEVNVTINDVHIPGDDKTGDDDTIKAARVQ